jgi:hypothetical protein
MVVIPLLCSDSLLGDLVASFVYTFLLSWSVVQWVWSAYAVDMIPHSFGHFTLIHS